MRKQVTVTFAAGVAQALMLRLESQERSPKLNEAMLAVRAALNAPPTPEEVRDESEKQAGFDRDAIGAAINKVLGLSIGYIFFEAVTPGEIAMERPSWDRVTKLHTLEAKRALADAAGHPLSEVDTCDWSFSDRPDEEAIAFRFSFGIDADSVIRDAREILADLNPLTPEDAPRLPEAAVDEFESDTNIILPTKLRQEVIAALSAN